MIRILTVLVCALWMNCANAGELKVMTFRQPIDLDLSNASAFGIGMLNSPQLPANAKFTSLSVTRIYSSNGGYFQNHEDFAAAGCRTKGQVHLNETSGIQTIHGSVLCAQEDFNPTDWSSWANSFQAQRNYAEFVIYYLQN